MISLSCIAQKAKYKLADQYFRSFDYANAAKIYEDILEKHPEDTIALRGAAMSYSNLRKPAKAEAKLKTLSELENVNPEDLFNYAHALRMNKEYDAALEVYRRLEKILPDDPVVLEYLSDPEVFDKIVRDSTRFDIKASSVNSEQSEFGVCVIDSANVYFSSSRSEGRGSGRVYNWNNQSYLNIFESSLGPDSSLSGAEASGRFFNTRYHEGSMSYDKVNDVLYFTRNNIKGSHNEQTSSAGNLNLAIFYAERKENGEWNEPKAFEYNNPEYSYGHPAASPDGNKLYFVSDQGGGLGGTDIWMCSKQDGKWSVPENLGFKINTPGNEMFPYPSGDKLFFASEGHPGLGGLDIFYAVLDGGAILNVNNLGYPVNSSADDFSFYIFPKSKRGFFSSNRMGGQGDDDIYELTISPPKTLHITGTIVDDATDEVLEGVTIILERLNGEDNGTLLGNSDENGGFEVETPFVQSLEIKALKQLYYPEVVEIETDPVSGYIENLEIRMKRFDYAVEGRVRLADTGQPTAGALVRLMDENGKLIEEIETAADGRYFFILEEDSNYTLEASYPDYLTLSEDVSTSGLEKGISYKDFTLFRPEKGTVVKLDNIYYDYNSDVIRPDAAKELDRLVKILKDNPSMSIELGSHSDSRGSDGYNLSLSKKRAKSAVNYLISQGIDSSRLVSKGYGETQIKNRCKNGVECSDEEHEVNRRTEFIILDI